MHRHSSSCSFNDQHSTSRAPKFELNAVLWSLRVLRGAHYNSSQVHNKAPALLLLARRTLQRAAYALTVVALAEASIGQL
jgi:hypothetical protein